MRKTELLKLVGEGNIREPLNYLAELETLAEKKQEIILLSARLERLEKEKRMDTLPFDLYNQEFNKIVLGVTELIQSIFPVYTNESDIERVRVIDSNIHICNSKNIVTGDIKASGNIIIGDDNKL